MKTTAHLLAYKLLRTQQSLRNAQIKLQKLHQPFPQPDLVSPALIGEQQEIQKLVKEARKEIGQQSI